MKNCMITLGLYFEITDSPMYGGEGTVGYANIDLDLEVASLESGNIQEYVGAQIEGIAEMCKVDASKVRVIPRTEYKENVED